MPKRSIVLPATPVIIVLEPPDARQYSPQSRRHTCMTCQDLFKLSPRSYATLRDLRREKRLYIVVCYGCFQILRTRLPARHRQTRVNTQQLRQILGMPHPPPGSNGPPDPGSDRRR